jgi:hypothetical protein
MRLLPPYLTALIQRGGPFVGADRSQGRVTVEKDWSLHQATNVFTEEPSKLPFRWWQRADNAQVETEVPNIKSISWDRNLDSDAGSCTIILYNQKMDPNVSGQNKMLGRPGYYTWHHRDANATSRWVNLIENEWRDVIVPNALLRTYEGYGGHGKPLLQAISDGNVVLTGVWLIDEVRVTADGLLSLTCRDMCKLLIEQQMYLPFMPAAKYPLAYSRWRYETFFYPAANVYDRVDPHQEGGPYFGPGAEGRKYITDLAMDSDGEGYGLVGTDGGVFCFNTTFFGSRGAGAVGTVAAIGSTPSGDGLWVVNAGGEVFTVGNAPNYGRVEDWPVLVDITNIVSLEPTHTGSGYWIVSDGGWVFSFGDAADHGGVPGTGVYTADMARTPNSGGYWLLNEDGDVYAYGNAAYHGNAPISPGHSAVGIAGSGGDGYYIASDDGAVYAFGNAVYRGRLGVRVATTSFVGAAATSSNGGYWQADLHGGVFPFGNATAYGDAPTSDATGFDARPQNDGYWFCAGDGAVFGLGGAGYHGRVNSPSAPITGMAATHTGGGYWLVGEDGGVFAFGDAGFYGSAVGVVTGVAVDMARTSNSGGYWVLGSAGHVYAYGNAGYHGNASVSATATGIAAQPNTDGYWVCSANGAVFAFGGAGYHGGASVNPSGGGRIVSIVGTSSGNGYWLHGADGAVYAFGDAAYLSGANVTFTLNKPIIDIVVTPTNGGYWLIAEDGGVFGFGDAGFHGSMANVAYTARGMARTGDGGGYWLVADGGAIEQFGNAADLGDAVGGVDNAPMRGFDMDPLGRGYWLAGADGAVFSFGEAVFYGHPTVDPNGAGRIIRLVAHPSGRGYWLLGLDGGVFAYGAAGFHGSAVGIIGTPAVDMAATPTGAGYWIVVESGAIFGFGDATYYGNPPIVSGDKAAGLAARPQGDGYWVVSEKGAIYALGAAKYETYNGDYAAAVANLQDPMIGIDAMPSGDGYLVVAGDGGVFSFGTAPFEGSLPADYSGTKRYDGNYRDFTDIIKDLLLWSGWLLYGATDTQQPGFPVYGNLETTGTFADDAFPPDTFDKKPVIDGINSVKEIIGFHFWIDEEGGARFESPNWYTYGNFIQDTGERTGQIPEIDERLHLTQYGLSYVDRPVRSEVIITSDDPTRATDTTITTRLVPTNPLLTQLLRGMVRPAMLPVPLNVTRAQQEDMARLIEIHMSFQLIQGQVSCVANPAVQINDQVRIYERVSGDTDVHYVRGVSSSHDLDTGVWTYELTTNRLGSGRTARVTGGIE